MKIAVVGSGISGLSAAYYLSKKNHVDLFEKEDHFGGHSHTIDLMIGTKKVPVDIGFIVFNFQTYPNLINFFKENKIEIEKIKSGEFDKIDNPIKNAPHTDSELASDNWEHKYSRQEAAYPAKFLKVNKFWPPVARVDNVYGDKNIFCTCPSMDEFKEDAA